MHQGLLVAFPGTGYTTREILFQECLAVYRERNYLIMELDFSMIPFKEIDTIEEAVAEANKQVLFQLGNIRFQEYQDVVFLSKSLGTVCAGCLEQTIPIRPRQLYLTPIKETLPYIKQASHVMAMVLGTCDRLMSTQELATFCSSMQIPFLSMEGVGHSLKADDDRHKTNCINKQIVALCS